MEYYIDSDTQIIHVQDAELLDPNGDPVFVTYTIDEWDLLDSN